MGWIKKLRELKIEHKRTEIENLLLSLGPTPDDVAAWLKVEGVKGLVGKANYCPIAQYLKKKYPLKEVNVSICRSYVDGIAVVNPPAISDFISEFDRYQYPEVAFSVADGRNITLL